MMDPTTLRIDKSLTRLEQSVTIFYMFWDTGVKRAQ